MNARGQAPVQTPSSVHTFRHVPGDGVFEWAPRCIDAMDAWEVDPLGWEPQWYRHMGRECCDIRVCPGCWLWQVEYDADGLNVRLDDLNAELPADCAADLADEHRTECPAFDMLAGLAGVPA